MRLSQELLHSVLPHAQVQGVSLPEDVSFSVDSRTIAHNQLFIPIKGSKVDGYDFIKDALRNGCGVLLPSKQTELIHDIVSLYVSTKTIIIVEDPLQALYALARAWRARCTFPIIGITGSIGKTSTKEFSAHIIRSHGINCFSSQGNQNTLLGIALNIVKMNDSAKIGIFEVGIGARSEMVHLVELLRPTVAVITYIGHSHMAGLGTLADIAAEKRKIFSYFSESDIGIINGDQPVLSAVGYAHPIIKFGQKTNNQVQARKIKVYDGKMSFILKIYHNKYSIVLPHTHQGMITNLLAAVTIAHFAGVSDGGIVQALQTLPTYAQRFEICPFKNDNGIVIDDCYNASPESVKAALLAFEHMNIVGEKIVVLGDMLELGNDSDFWHRQVGRFLKKSRSIKKIVLVGKHMQAVKETAPYDIIIETAKDWQEAIEKVQLLAKQKIALLVKGSRGMHLEHVVQAFSTKGSQNVL